jgi:hypothetical protein
VALYVPVLAWWVVLQPIAWKLEANPTFFIGAAGALMLLVAALHPPGSPMAIPFRFYGFAVVGATLVVLSFHAFNESVAEAAARDAHWLGGIEQMVLILGLAALVLVAIYFLQARAAPGPDPRSAAPAAAIKEILERQALPCGLLALFAFLAVWVPAARDPWVPTVAANVAMVVVALALVRQGLAEYRGRPFAAGVGYLLLWVVLRYADLFGAFGGMLGAALVFFLCGAALMGVALYWRSRKAVSLG